MTEEEIQAKIDAAVEAATKGLKSKNEELLANLKKEKDEKKAALEASEAAQAEAEEKAALAAAKEGDIEKVKATIEAKFQKEIDKLKAESSTWKEKYNTGVVDRDLTDALAKAGIVSDSLEDVRIVLKAKHKVEVGEDGATIEGKAIKDFVSEWSQGDAAKRYVAAPNNGGGGAGGSNGGGKASGDNIKNLPPVARLTAAREAQSKT